jgi:hypothetical protein
MVTEQRQRPSSGDGQIAVSALWQKEVCPVEHIPIGNACNGVSVSYELSLVKLTQ